MTPAFDGHRACRHEHWKQRLYFPEHPPIMSLPLPTIAPLENGTGPRKAAKKVAKKKAGSASKPQKRSADAAGLDL